MADYGATSGFGQALAHEAIATGDVVVGAGRNQTRLDELATDARARTVPSGRPRCHRVEAGRRVVNEVVDRHGRDVVVNNAGRTQVGALEETTDQELRELFDLHFFGPAALTRAALPHMRHQGGGWIVQMSSVGGQVTAAGLGAYCATKRAGVPFERPPRVFACRGSGVPQLRD